MNEKQMEADLREAYQRITDLEAALVTYGQHLSHCDQEKKAEPTGCDCGYTKAISPIEVEMPKIESTPCNEANYFLRRIQGGAKGEYVSGGDGITIESAKKIVEGKPLSWESHVPRDPLQGWTFNGNGDYCPTCGDEDIRNSVRPIAGMRVLPDACSRCGKECKHPEKGDRGAECNRTVCENKKANWFNHSTRAWYCQKCAAKLNHANHEDAQRLYGHALCTFGSQGARE